MGGARGSRQKNPGASCWHVKGMSRRGAGVDASTVGVERVEGTGVGLPCQGRYPAMRMGRYPLPDGVYKVYTDYGHRGSQRCRNP